MADLLEGLRIKFRARCEGDAVAIAAHLDGRPADEPLERIIHRIAGAAGMFGAPDLGQAAQKLDEGFADGRQPSEADLRNILALIAAL